MGGQACDCLSRGINRKSLPRYNSDRCVKTRRRTSNRKGCSLETKRVDSVSIHRLASKIRSDAKNHPPYYPAQRRMQFTYDLYKRDLRAHVGACYLRERATDNKQNTTGEALPLNHLKGTLLVTSDSHISARGLQIV